jgi:hypothetical protein
VTAGWAAANGAQVKALASATGAEFFVITLPMLADLAAQQAPAARAKQHASG